MSLALLFHYLLLNMFRMLVHPSSGACNLLWIYFTCCNALVRRVLVLRCGSARVVWYQHTSNQSTISRKLLKMDVLTFETCWVVNSEIIKQVISSWSIFIQLSYIKLSTRIIPLVLVCSESISFNITELHSTCIGNFKSCLEESRRLLPVTQHLFKFFM